MAIGLLLAAGKGTRFDPSGQKNKLLQTLPGGPPVAAAAARRLCAVLDTVIAVVRDAETPLAQALHEAGCQVLACPTAGQGMGASLAWGVRASPAGSDLIIALADMPFIRHTTLQALAQALQAGADIAAPVYQGQRGHPVAFSARHRPQLLALGGDQGARRLLQAGPVTLVPVTDPGILRDIDTPGDLPARGTAPNPETG